MGFNQSTIDNRSNQQSGQALYCTASRRSSWHNGRASQWAGLCVCSAIMLSLSHPPSSPRDLWVKGQHPRRPFQRTQWDSIHNHGRTERKEERNVLSDIRLLSLHLSIISPHLSEQSRHCPHPLTVTRPPVCCPSLKQTLSAHIPLLHRTRLYTVCVNPCQSTLKTASSAGHVEQTPPCEFVL